MLLFMSNNLVNPEQSLPEDVVLISLNYDVTKESETTAGKEAPP